MSAGNDAPRQLASGSYIGFGKSFLGRIRQTDPLIILRKIVWNIVLLFIGLFIGFVIIQHAMFYSFPPDPSEFLYVQKEVYVIFSLAFVLSTRALFFIENKIRNL